jgi:hypothetical protein
MHAGELAEMQLLEHIKAKLVAATHRMRGAIAVDGARRCSA